MKYKIKYELDYSDLSKEEIRDLKIKEVLSDDNEMLSIEIDPQIKLPLPEVDGVIDINGKDYQIRKIKHKIESDCYTVIYLVDSVESIRKKEEESRDRQRRSMMAMLR
jgi:hypothetical protein